jgi:hypothetical protein
MHCHSMVAAAACELRRPLWELRRPLWAPLSTRTRGWVGSEAPPAPPRTRTAHHARVVATALRGLRVFTRSRPLRGLVLNHISPCIKDGSSDDHGSRVFTRSRRVIVGCRRMLLNSLFGCHYRDNAAAAAAAAAAPTAIGLHVAADTAYGHMYCHGGDCGTTCRGGLRASDRWPRRC